MLGGRCLLLSELFRSLNKAFQLAISSHHVDASRVDGLFFVMGSFGFRRVIRYMVRWCLALFRARGLGSAEPFDLIVA